MLPSKVVFSLLVFVDALLDNAFPYIRYSSRDCAFRTRGGRKDVKLAGLWVYTLDSKIVTAELEVLSLAVDFLFSAKRDLGRDSTATDNTRMGRRGCDRRPRLGNAWPCTRRVDWRRWRRVVVWCTASGTERRRDTDRALVRICQRVLSSKPAIWVSWAHSVGKIASSIPHVVGIGTQSVGQRRDGRQIRIRFVLDAVCTECAASLWLSAREELGNEAGKN